MLVLVCALLVPLGEVLVDFDEVRQVEGRWRCLIERHFSLWLDEALGANRTAEGGQWTAAHVGSVLGVLSGCDELVADVLPQRWVAPLASALRIHCAPPAHATGHVARLRTMDLDGSRLGDGSVAELAVALGTCASLEAVHALENRLGDAAAAALATAFAAHPTLRILDLGGNSVADMGATALGEVLLGGADDAVDPAAPRNLSAASPALRELRLHDNLIGAAGARALARALRAPAADAPGARLEVLLLDGNPIGDDGAIAIADALGSRSHDRPSSLTILGLAATNLTDTGVRHFVASCPLRAKHRRRGSHAYTRSSHTRARAPLTCSPSLGRQADALLAHLSRMSAPPPLQTISLGGNEGLSASAAGRVRAWIAVRAAADGRAQLRDDARRHAAAVAAGEAADVHARRLVPSTGICPSPPTPPGVRFGVLPPGSAPPADWAADWADAG